MRISFEDGGYIELQRSKTPGKIWVSIGASAMNNPLELLVHSAEIDIVKLNEAIKSVTGPQLINQ